MMLWLAILIVKPILVKQRLLNLHRVIGKTSYAVMPVLVWFMLQAYRLQYLRGVSNQDPVDMNNAVLLVPFTDTFPFLLLYVLSMAYRQRTKYHVRFIICSALVLIGPPLGRLIVQAGYTDFFAISLVTYLVSDVIIIGLYFYDRSLNVRFKISPYLLSVAILVLCQTTLLYLPGTSLWNSIAEWMAASIIGDP